MLANRTKSYGPNYTKFRAFDKKRVFKTIFDKALTPFWKTLISVAEIIV